MLDLHAKLARACARRAVVCASPEAIKSVVLKFVEQCHAIEQVNLADLLPPRCAFISLSLNLHLKFTRVNQGMLSCIDSMPRG